MDTAGVERSDSGEVEGRDAALTVERFNPRSLSAAQRAAVGPMVRDAVTAAHPRDKRDATELMTRVTALAAWCHTRGIDVSTEVVFAPATVDRFVLEGCAHLSAGSRANYRSVLTRVGRAVLGPLVYPPRTPFRLSPHQAPYSAREAVLLVGWSRGLPTDRMRFGVEAMLALGFGAGLTAAELSRTHHSWVECSAGRWSIVVPEPRARVVPVASRWVPTLRRVMDRSGGGLLFLAHRQRVTGKQLSAFTGTLPHSDAPRLSAQRLRATWIVDLLDRGVPLNAITQVAGVGASHLAGYVRYMQAVTPEVVDRLVRGADAP